MNYRQVPASALRSGRVNWLHVLMAGVVLATWGHEAKAQPAAGGLPAVYVTADPIAPLAAPPAPSLAGAGTGLCGAFRAVGDTSFFPSRDTSQYPGSVTSGMDVYAKNVNDVMDGIKSTSTTDGKINYETLQTPFDLAAQKNPLNGITRGDFLTAGCAMGNVGGCPFPASTPNVDPNNGSLPPFAGRYRGFFLVTDGLVKQSIHFGFTTKSAVAMRFYPKLPTSDGSPAPYELISREFGGGANDFRVTNTIIFMKTGWYAVEILYVAGTQDSHLEMAVTTQPSFVDIDQQATMGSSLSTSGFMITTPDMFFQRLNGALPFPGSPAACAQCPHSKVGLLPGDNDCPSCMACNESGVCEVCDSPDHCGCKTCGPCKDPTPFCNGTPGDPASYECVMCRTTTDCPSGEICTADHVCKGYCPCCDAPLVCTNTDGNKIGALNCSQCDKDHPCANNGYCDLINGRCVDTKPAHGADNDCGANPVDCVASTKGEVPPRPFCLNAQVCVQCRFTSDCAQGTYCRSGDCVSCTDDRHCGPSCTSCGLTYATDANGNITGTKTTTPFCYAPTDNNAPVTPACVECLTDPQCGPGGTCDLGTHTCSTRAVCSMSCADGMVCSGGSCVECLTSSQCNCGMCVAGLCTKSCGDSTDCTGNQCCTQETGTCTSGRCAPDYTAHGGAACCDVSASAISGATDPAAPVHSRAALWTMLVALGLLAALKLRALRPGSRAAGGGRK